MWLAYVTWFSSLPILRYHMVLDSQGCTPRCWGNVIALIDSYWSQVQDSRSNYLCLLFTRNPTHTWFCWCNFPPRCLDLDESQAELCLKSHTILANTHQLPFAYN
jgi:hypothetical protein